MIDFSSRQLRAFLLVAQHQNFTRAAEALFITPSGLSLLVREFENQLGFRLFDRTTRHVVLTSQGTELLAAARRSLEDLDAAMSQIGKRAREASHTFSIAGGQVTCAYILPQALKEFGTRRPELRIEVVDGDPSTFLQRVADGSLDMAIGTFPRASGIQRTLFFRFGLIVIRAESETNPRRSSTTWSGLKGESLILPSFESFRSITERQLTRAGVPIRPAMILSGLDTIVGMVEAGQGTGIIPSFALPACRHRRVAISRLTNPPVPIDFYQIRNRGRKLSAAAEEFTTFLQAYIARWAGRAGLP